LLILSVVPLMGNNSLAFSIFVTFNIKASVISDVYEVGTIEPEDLPPVGVGAPDLHLV
jgi:hypothetical protein